MHPVMGSQLDATPQGEATAILIKEHGLILRALGVLQGLVERLEGGAAVPAEPVAQLVEFFRRFADAAHHEKEERVLFPALEAAGLARQGGPIAVMCDEHDRGRRLLLSLTEELPELGRSETARGRFLTAARAYGGLLRNHIEKENTVLFRFADRLLGDKAQRELAEDFARHCGALLEPGEAERLERSVDEVALALR